MHGAIGNCCIYEHIASLISERYSQSYGTIWYCLPCKLISSLMQSAITCLRGSRSSKVVSIFQTIDLVCTECNLDHLELVDSDMCILFHFCMNIMV